jgi:hypothetical protein
MCACWTKPRYELHAPGNTPGDRGALAMHERRV